MANKVRHTHKYYYDPKNEVWVCSGYKGCSHFRPKNMPDPIGVKSICWRCEGEFIFTEDNLKQANPRCSKCSKKVDLYEVTPYFDEWQEYRIRTQNFIEYEEFEVIRAKGLDRQPLNKPAIRPAPDEVEVIEPDEPAPIVLTTVIEDEGEHAPDCDSFFGRECNCRV